MPIILPNGLSPEEIRVLQEFRRLSKETLALSTLGAIRHPAGGGEHLVSNLVQKGYVQADPSGESISLTEKARAFLAIEAKPDVAETSQAGASAASNPKADGV